MEELSSYDNETTDCVHAFVSLSFPTFSASTEAEQHQILPNSWVPTETLIVNRDMLALCSLHNNSIGRRVKEELGVMLASCAGKDKDSKRRKARRPRKGFQKLKLKNLYED